MVFVLYLIYTELFTLNAICLFCTIVHVITFLLFALIVFSFAAGVRSARDGIAPLTAGPVGSYHGFSSRKPGRAGRDHDQEP